MKNILIIGDGIIGMLSAIVLSSIYQNVYLIRRTGRQKYQHKHDRFFSINLLTKYYFIKHGIWKDIIAQQSKALQ